MTENVLFSFHLGTKYNASGEIVHSGNWINDVFDFGRKGELIKIKYEMVFLNHLHFLILLSEIITFCCFL